MTKSMVFLTHAVSRCQCSAIGKKSGGSLAQAVSIASKFRRKEIHTDFARIG